VYPAQLPSLWRMKRRVSISVAPMLKFFTSTLPFGKSKSLFASIVMFSPSGSASQRVFTAPSEKNGAFGA
jgi:hypothetical protein